MPSRRPRALFVRLATASFLGSVLLIVLLSAFDFDEVQAVGAALLVSLVTAGALSMTMTKPLRLMRDALERLGRGDWPARVAFRSDDELGEVARAIDGAAEQLGERFRGLENRLRHAEIVLESMVEGVVALNRGGRVLWLNDAAQRLLGITREQAAGQRLEDLVRQPEMSAAIRQVIDRERPVMQELRFFGPREQVLRLQASPSPGGVHDAAVVLVVEDVTEVRRLEGMRREFVANVSHELKTPLTSIKGLVETLLGGALEDPSNNRRFVTMVEQDAARLTRLIDDLLELSQIESKAVSLQLQPVELRPLFDELISRLSRQCQEHQVSVDVRVAPGLCVKGDPDRLRQIFLNLLDNAIKFNKPGGRVTVAARAAGASVETSVEDTGVGIPDADVPRIFERFYRVDKARSRELGGTGLGLSIVKHLVDLHQGHIGVRSQSGAGSTFTVTLPLAS